MASCSPPKTAMFDRLLRELGVDAVAEVRSAAADAATVAPPPAVFYCVVEIDHMNNGLAYTASLRDWAAQLKLRGHLFWYAAPRAASGRRLAAPHRREGAVLVLRSVKSMLPRRASRGSLTRHS